MDLDDVNANRTRKTIEAEGGDASVFIANLTKSAHCSTMVEAAVTRYGGLHALVNNVGFAPYPYPRAISNSS